MGRNLLITVCALASAVFAFEGPVYLERTDNILAGPASSYIATPSDGREVIYDGQTYDFDEIYGGFNITSPTYKLADDFEVDDDWRLEVNKVWISSNDGPADIIVEIFADSGDGPDDDDVLFTETVSGSDQTWTDTGDVLYDYTIWEVDIPISGFEVVPGTRYWLSLQYQGGRAYWNITYHDLAWWDVLYTSIHSVWRSSYEFVGRALGCFFELHGVITDHLDPEITETFPHDSDFPSGVPVDTDVTFHVTDDLSGCNPDETGVNVEHDGNPLVGMLTWDDSDPLDVYFEWEPDVSYPGGAEIHVAVETYDIYGNGPVTEEWSFTTGYVNVAPVSLGAIKAGFAE
jgi:hypothetical protein